MDKKTKNILSYAFWTLVAGLLIWFCLRAVDWEQFTEALMACRWEYILLSMLLGIAVFYIRSLRWKMLLDPFDPSTRAVTTFNAYNICMAVNLVLPRAGEVARLGYVVRHSAVGEDGKRLLTFDKALGTLLVERVWDALVTLGMGAVLLIVKWADFGPYLQEMLSQVGIGQGLWWAMGAAVALIVALIFLAWKYRERSGIWSKTWNFLVGIGRGLLSFRQMKRAWLFFLYTAVIWVIYWIMSASIIWALQDVPAFTGLTLTDAFFLMIAGSISSVVPVPGGFGAYHGVVAGALHSIWKLPVSTGMVYATLNHESQVLTQAIAGLASYIHESFIRRAK